MEVALEFFINTCYSQPLLAQSFPALFIYLFTTSYAIPGFLVVY